MSNPIRNKNEIAIRFEDHGRKAALEVLRFPSSTHAKRYVRKHNLHVICADFQMCAVTQIRNVRCDEEPTHVAR